MNDDGTGAWLSPPRVRIRDLHALLTRWPRRLWYLIGAILVLSAGLGDHVTGDEVAFTLLYFVPIALVAWFSGRRAGIACAIVCTIVWFVVNLHDHPYASELVRWWNVGIELGVFLVIAVLLGVLRVGQGVASGGQWDGLSSLLALNAPEDKRGWYAMLGQLGAPLGFIIAAALFSYLLANITTEDFLRTVKDALAVVSKDGKLPCTLLILDELQQYVGDSHDSIIDP